ncbi:unnamed protein product [Absidia cylindrospora]
MIFYPIVFIVILSSYTSSLLVSSAPVELENRSKVVNKVKNALFRGVGTYYEVPGVGSCGKPDTDDEMVVAVNASQMKNGSNPNKNPECEKYVVIEGDQGKTVTARIVDTCPTCPPGGLDMSPKVFKAVCGGLSKGKCKIKWHFK